MEEPRHPVSGIDYPGTFQEFDKWFSSENACLDYIAKLRWPKGFICPSCGINTDKPSLMERGLFLCRKCKRQTSITAGPLFRGSHKPLLTWFLAMWFVTSQKHGASALGLQRVLGLGRVQIYLCHKFSGQKLKEIGLHFGIGVSGVSQASRRVALQIKDDKKLKKKIDKIISDLNLSTV